MDDGTIAIGCTFVKKTVSNIRRNNKVAIAATKFDGGYDGYMVKGTAEVIEKGETFDLMNKAVHEATGGRRTVRWVVLVSTQEVYSLKPSDARKRVR